MLEQPEIKEQYTSCRNCVFADYVDDTQVGCDLHALDAFRKHTEVIGAYDDELKFEIINGRLCQFFRTEEWAEQHKEDSLTVQVNKEVEIQYSLILFLDNGIEMCLENAMKYIKPKQIILVSRQNNPKELQELVIKYNIPWRIQCTDNSASDEEALDLAVKAVTNPYFLVYKEVLTTEIPYFINNLINKQLISPAYIDLAHGYFAPKPIYDFMQGNKFGLTFKEKVEKMCPERLYTELNSL